MGSTTTPGLRGDENPSLDIHSLNLERSDQPIHFNHQALLEQAIIQSAAVSQLNSMDLYIRQLETNTENIQDENNQLRNEVGQLKIELVELREETEQLNREMDDLSEQIKENTRLLAEKNRLLRKRDQSVKKNNQLLGELGEEIDELGDIVKNYQNQVAYVLQHHNQLIKNYRHHQTTNQSYHFPADNKEKKRTSTRAVKHQQVQNKLQQKKKPALLEIKSFHVRIQEAWINLFFLVASCFQWIINQLRRPSKHGVNNHPIFFTMQESRKNLNEERKKLPLTKLPGIGNF